jgi:DNA topoisomerase I
MALVFVGDDLPGITRRRRGGRWKYLAPGGGEISDPAEIARLNAVALPPAYTDAWFAPAGDAHILATGIDARGRKQYRYHPKFRTEREAHKFDACADFGRRLRLIRQRVEDDLKDPGLTRERAIASVVRLLDTGGIRIGNEAYAKANRSFGATTLRMRHVAITGTTLRLSFRAKSGKQCMMRVSDRGLARFVRRMQDLPGQHLFQYLDEAGAPSPVTSSDVNAYLKATMEAGFTAKHFRTWTASALAFGAIHSAKADLARAELLQQVADQLGNTPAIARKSYVHPAVLAVLDDQAAVRQRRLPRATRWLDRTERGLIDFLDNEPAALDLLSA